MIQCHTVQITNRSIRNGLSGFDRYIHCTMRLVSMSNTHNLSCLSLWSKSKNFLIYIAALTDIHICVQIQVWLLAIARRITFCTWLLSCCQRKHILISSLSAKCWPSMHITFRKVTTNINILSEWRKMLAVYHQWKHFYSTFQVKWIRIGDGMTV